MSSGAQRSNAICAALAAGAALLAGCAHRPSAQDPYAGVDVHAVPKEMTPLVSQEGQWLLDTEAAIDCSPLTRNWMAQLPAHCGAATAVVTLNTLQPDAGLTQDTLFTPETAHIITQDRVYEVGFTLDELTEMIRVRSGLSTQSFRAGPEPGQFSHTDFVEALRRNRESADDHVVINFSTRSLRGEGMGGGHWCPIADYNEAEDMVLVLEINASRESFWVSSRDLYEAMNSTDPVCDLNRGWIVVSR